MTTRPSRKNLAPILTAVVLLALAFAASGCKPTTPAPTATPPATTAPPASSTPSATTDGALPTETPGITGAITYVAAGTDVALGTISVEGGTQPEGAVSDKAVVSVTKQTAIFDASGGKATPADLQVGAEVKVWFTGPVAESYPVQGAAAAVQITGEAPKE